MPVKTKPWQLFVAIILLATCIATSTSRKMNANDRSAALDLLFKPFKTMDSENHHHTDTYNSEKLKAYNNWENDKNIGQKLVTRGNNVIINSNQNIPIDLSVEKEKRNGFYHSNIDPFDLLIKAEY